MLAMVVTLVIVGLIVIGVISFLGFVILAGTERSQKKAEANAGEILARTFDGTAHVTFPMNLATLKYGTVVTGAAERGYKLVSQAGNQYGPTELVFEKV